MNTITQGTCRFEPCEENISYVKESLCIGHYKQFRAGKRLHIKSGTMRSLHGDYCARPDCDREIVIRFGGLCGAHGRQFERWGWHYAVKGDGCDYCEGIAWRFGACKECFERARLGEISVRGVEPYKACEALQCDRLVTPDTTYCATHTMRKTRGMVIDGAIERTPDAPDRECAASGCAERAESRTGSLIYCPVHGSRHRRRGSVEAIRVPNGTYTGRVCIVPDCGVQIFSSWLCAGHCARAGKFGLSPIQMVMVIEMQECAICGSSDTPLVIDHDHRCCDQPSRSTCGECTRGLICSPCNLGLGAFRDNPDRLRAAALYLERE